MNKLLLIIALLAVMIKGDETMPDTTTYKQAKPTTTVNTPPAWWQEKVQRYGQPWKPKGQFGTVRGTSGAISGEWSPETIGKNIPATQYDTAYFINQARRDEAVHQAAQTGRPVTYTPFVPTGSFVGRGGQMALTAEGAAQTQQARVQPPKPPSNLPAWIGAPAANVKSRNKQNTGTPTGTFTAQGGDVVQGPTGAPKLAYTPVSSVQSGGGNFVMGPNGVPYYVGTPGPNTFIAAGGEAVRGPDYGYEIPMEDSGGGFGTQYNWGRGGRRYGGGGRGYLPSWLMGLYSWNFKG